MSWKKTLKVQENIISPEVDEYLKKHDFYESTMAPRFFGKETHNHHIINEDAPCLRLDTDDPQDTDYTMRIFINSTEAYMEVQTSYRSFNRSYHLKFEEAVDMYNIESILDLISEM